jgi:hypothetical protein
MQISLLAGRELEERDRPESLPVAIVNQTRARVNLGIKIPWGSPPPRRSMTAPLPSSDPSLLAF